MTYSTACELLGFTTPKSLTENARLASGRLDRLNIKAPLRYKVACMVLIKAAE
jgi:hypothetical protein